MEKHSKTRVWVRKEQEKEGAMSYSHKEFLQKFSRVKECPLYPSRNAEDCSLTKWAIGNKGKVPCWAKKTLKHRLDDRCVRHLLVEILDAPCILKRDVRALRRKAYREWEALKSKKCYPSPQCLQDKLVISGYYTTYYVREETDPVLRREVAKKPSDNV